MVIQRSTGERNGFVSSFLLLPETVSRINPDIGNIDASVFISFSLPHVKGTFLLNKLLHGFAMTRKFGIKRL